MKQPPCLKLVSVVSADVFIQTLHECESDIVSITFSVVRFVIICKDACNCPHLKCKKTGLDAYIFPLSLL